MGPRGVGTSSLINLVLNQYQNNKTFKIFELWDNKYKNDVEERKYKKFYSQK